MPFSIAKETWIKKTINNSKHLTEMCINLTELLCHGTVENKRGPKSLTIVRKYNHQVCGQSSKLCAEFVSHSARYVEQLFTTFKAEFFLAVWRSEAGKSSWDRLSWKTCKLCVEKPEKKNFFNLWCKTNCTIRIVQIVTFQIKILDRNDCLDTRTWVEWS